jgi:mannose-6-phosphate isomerase-like protein (cupin superfamily)
MRVRRVVTGQVEGGRSTVVQDADVPATSVAVAPGTVFHQIWGADAPVELPTDGTEPAWKSFFPPTSGFRFLIFTMGPETTELPADIDLNAALEELNIKLPGLVDFNEPDAPGMHTTDTIDFDYVIQGEVWLELDGGEEVHLRAGDCVIQNGTRHAWHNRSTEPVTIATTLIGTPAKR